MQATDRIGGITSHNLFGNLFYDFVNTSRFTPYIGVGGGVGFTNMEYGSVWVRNEDSMKADGSYRITTGEGLPNYNEIRRKLAKTASVGQATLSDENFKCTGSCSRWAFTESTSLGLKGRSIRVTTSSGIRSHEESSERRQANSFAGQTRNSR